MGKQVVSAICAGTTTTATIEAIGAAPLGDFAKKNLQHGYFKFSSRCPRIQLLVCVEEFLASIIGAHLAQFSVLDIKLEPGYLQETLGFGVSTRIHSARTM